MKDVPDLTRYILLNDYSEFLGISRIDNLMRTDWFKFTCNYIKNDVKEEPYIAKCGRYGGGTYIHWFLACFILLNKSPNSLYRLFDIEINAFSGVDKFKNMLEFHENIEREIFIKNWIYVIKNDSGNFKIGMSKDPDNRLKSLQCGNPEKLNIVWKCYTFNAMKIEKKTHERFLKYRLNGEWFDGSKLKLNTIKDSIQNDCDLEESIIETCKYPERRYLDELNENNQSLPCIGA
jgi:hypothetical protein